MREAPRLLHRPQLPLRQVAAGVARLEAGLLEQRHELLAAVAVGDRAVLAVRGAVEGLVGGLAGPAAVADQHLPRHVEVEPDRVAVVDHDRALAARAQHAVQLAQDRPGVARVVQDALAGDEVELAVGERQGGPVVGQRGRGRRGRGRRRAATAGGGRAPARSRTRRRRRSAARRCGSRSPSRRCPDRSRSRGSPRRRARRRAPRTRGTAGTRGSATRGSARTVAPSGTGRH